jgi:hypothetical protein
MAEKKKDNEETKVPDVLAGVTPNTGGGTPVVPTDVNILDWPDEPLRVTSTTPVDVNVKSGAIDVTLHSTRTASTNVQGFWEYLRQKTEAISFNNYSQFIEDVLCQGEDHVGAEEVLRLRNSISNRIAGVDTYQLLRVATEAFLLLQCGTKLIDKDPTRSASRFGGTSFDHTTLSKKLSDYLGLNGITPYIERIVHAYSDIVADGVLVPPLASAQVENPIFCDDIDTKVLQPCFLELIWSYWQEELGLVQAINAISLRFQNKRGPGDRDVLANLETHPLRPVANLLWGYVQDEDHRLTVARRSYEYEHQYGIGLVGRAVPKLRPADSRSKFLESFHTLLHQAAIFYDRSSNLTVRADAFPLLNALREVHLVLAEGAHNQFRELPWEARVEMLVQQWLLSRNEIREFLGGRPAVPYAEDWMRPVDALRRVMGWGDTSVTHFNDLAITGEKIVLSVRFGDWSDRNATDDDATGWAVFWKPEIQRYIHAYQAVTGVDLSATTTQSNRQIDSTPPSVLLQQRMARQRR